MDPNVTPELSRSKSPRFSWWDLVVTLLFISVIVLALAKNYQSESFRRSAEPSIRNVLDSQVDAWNRGDLDGFMKGYWNSDDLVFCSGGTITKGWQPTLDRYRKRYQEEGRAMGVLAFSDVHVDVVTNDVAIVRGRWRLQLPGSNPEGLFTLKMARFGNDWRVVYDHTSVADETK